MTDSYHFHIEPEPRVEAPNFRVGGVYRNRNRQTVVLSLKSYFSIHSEWADRAYANVVNGAGEVTDGAGICRLSDGRCYFNSSGDDGDDLIPGELVQRDGQWVAADAPIVFPSGAAVLTSGDKIVGRVEAQAEPLTDLIKRVFSHPTPTQHYTVDPNARMKVRDAGLYPSRAPLPHFNQRTAHDPFGPDFIVTKGAVEAPPTPDPTTQGAYPAIAGLLRG